MSERNGRPVGDRVGSRRADPAPAAGQERGATVGPYLAAQRRMRNISLDELADRTKIPRRNLERLESGALDTAPDGFTRGFVRTVAEALGLDPDEAVMRLMREPPADDAGLVGARRMRVFMMRAALGAAAVIALVLLLRFASSLLAPVSRGDSQTPEMVYRRDAVHSLAETTREEPLAPSAAATPEPLREDAESIPRNPRSVQARQPSRVD